MKKLFLILNFFIAFFLFENSTKAQIFSLDSITGFPDTVQNGQILSLNLYYRVTGAPFVGELAILLNSENHDSIVDTLLYFPTITLSGNGAIDSLPFSYTVDAAELDGGDNIVVVWPASANGSVNPDSLLFHTILKNVGISENENRQVVEIYPSPVYDILRLLMSHPEKVEQVRIYDVLGNELMNFNRMVDRFNVESLSSGVYFVIVRNKDQSIVVKKFFRE
ncbi:MAG: T9SS type A sorting domain-containing protein [Bacteroidota bacterium]